MKTCKQCGNTYSSDLFSKKVRMCNYCREQNSIKQAETKKRWRLNNADKVAETQRRYREHNPDQIKEKNRTHRESEAGKATIQANRQKVYHCELCDCDIEREKKSQHEKSRNHQYVYRKV